MENRRNRRLKEGYKMENQTAFIRTSDRLVNLANVSNINAIERTSRIVFNMNYYIEIEKFGETKLISDYCYHDLLSESQYNDAMKILQENEYFKNNFITHENASVNINEISSIKFSDKKKRGIINLSHPVTFTDFSGANNITSEFVYFNYDSYNDYKDAEKNIKLTLGT